MNRHEDRRDLGARLDAYYILVQGTAKILVPHWLSRSQTAKHEDQRNPQREGPIAANNKTVFVEKENLIPLPPENQRFSPQMCERLAEEAGASVRYVTQIERGTSFDGVAIWLQGLPLNWPASRSAVL